MTGRHAFKISALIHALWKDAEIVSMGNVLTCNQMETVSSMMIQNAKMDGNVLSHNVEINVGINLAHQLKIVTKTLANVMFQ